MNCIGTKGKPNEHKSKSMKKISYILLTLSIVMIVACRPQNKAKKEIPFKQIEFDTSTLAVKTTNYKNVKGQLLYLPSYSNIPTKVDSTEYSFDMSSFVAIHNTDLINSIIVTKVLYFNENGKPVYDLLNNKTMKLNPMETIDFYIPHEDQSGNGANFLVEWVSDQPVNEPLIESVTYNLKSYHSAAIVSTGRIIREIK